jgi:hypothetical protein
VGPVFQTTTLLTGDMGKPINQTTARLLCLIGEQVWETVRDGKPIRFVFLDSFERGAIAPCLVTRLAQGISCVMPGAQVR